MFYILNPPLDELGEISNKDLYETTTGKPTEVQLKGECLILFPFVLIYPRCFFFSTSAHDAGYFNEEMAPIEVKTRKGKQTMQMDEHARPQTTLEQLNKLAPVFKKEGTVTAGNASVRHRQVSAAAALTAPGQSLVVEQA